MTGVAARPPCAIPDTPLAAAVPGIMTCVHCGFCLQACPTYLALGDENDSPRGRIMLMRALVEGELPVDDDSVRTHIDQCLGCRACETACPSGVPYGEMLEATRATLTQVKPNPPLARLILWIFARTWLMRALLAGAHLLRATRLPALMARLPGRLGFAMGMLSSTQPPFSHDGYAARGNGTRARVATLLGCVMESLYAHTNRATERVLATNDYALVDAPGQGCCGALHAHAGDADGARALARRNIAAFERSGAELIAVNAAGCGAAMKEYGHLLSEDPEWAPRANKFAARVHDVTELLAAAGPAPGAALPILATYDAPCHLLHAQRIAAPPLATLAAIPSLELVPLTDADQCCGSAGIFSLTESGLSARVLAPKLDHIDRSGATLVISANPGCLMQIGAGLAQRGGSVRVAHVIDVLDTAYSRRTSRTAEA
ncbi:MAG: heterodisulfide reductase-related iron-sulfur binding cluster [Gemmatimonadota bacterium]|nr:heterodisulfide reductase-related iron-sulfur binding cluster [Gemmatimonadota bacterium]